jgi:predicted O-methyltransferase YrrM
MLGAGRMVDDQVWGLERYSLRDLERLTKVSWSALARMIPVCVDDEMLPITPTWSIDRASLENLMLRLAPLLGAEGTKWPIPAELRNNHSAWAEALVDIYEQDVSYPYSISPRLGQMLRELVCVERPAVVVEVGCLLGVSTVWAASALPPAGSGIVHTIDRGDPLIPAPPHHFGFVSHPSVVARALVDKADLGDRVQFHHATSRSICTEQPQWLTSVDILILDGDHSVGGALFDFIHLGAKVRSGGLVLMHDINADTSGVPGPRYVLDMVVRKTDSFEAVELGADLDDFGLAVIRKQV